MEMATTFPVSSPSHHHNFFAYSKSKTFYSYPPAPLIFSPLHPHRPSLPIRLRSNSCNRSPRCFSAGPGPGPGPPSPPGSDPPCPPGKLSSFQDRARIFFAVLFWMSLFFWSSVWNGRDPGRSNKGSRFRR